MAFIAFILLLSLHQIDIFLNRGFSKTILKAKTHYPKFPFVCSVGYLFMVETRTMSSGFQVIGTAGSYCRLTIFSAY
jgi:hypothetical protein